MWRSITSGNTRKQVILGVLDRVRLLLNDVDSCLTALQRSVAIKAFPGKLDKIFLEKFFSRGSEIFFWGGSGPPWLRKNCHFWRVRPLKWFQNLKKSPKTGCAKSCLFVSFRIFLCLFVSVHFRIFLYLFVPFWIMDSYLIKPGRVSNVSGFKIWISKTTLVKARILQVTELQVTELQATELQVTELQATDQGRVDEFTTPIPFGRHHPLIPIGIITGANLAQKTTLATIDELGEGSTALYLFSDSGTPP